MAIMDKKSVRDEFDRLKTDFNKLSSDKKVSPEIRTLVNGLFMLMEVILAIFLEKKTKKTNKNSSKPSSQTEKDESSLPSKGSKGKGNSEQSRIADNTRTVETTTVIPVDYCTECGESLEETACLCQERRTRIDIIFEKTVEHFDAQIKECPNCQAQVKATFPDDLKGPVQYGNGIKAFVVCLLITQMVALKRAQKMLNTLIGKVLSEATLLGYIMRLHTALAPWEASVKEALLKSSAIHTDETSLRVDKKNHWIHVYSSGDITLKFLHRKRGKIAMEAIDIIPRYGGTIIHDCWASYLSYGHCSHGLCGSHILRELTFIIESNQYRWAKNIKKLLQEACRAVSKSKSKKLSKAQYARLQRRYRNILTRGESELPPVLKKSDGKHGKIAKSDAHNLLDRLIKHEEAVLLFARDPHVAFTNNRAERDLRMAKVKQKVSGCFRSQKYAHAYCRISSYLQTMASRGVNPLIAIQMALTGKLELWGE
jgi:transposase